MASIGYWNGYSVPDVTLVRDGVPSVHRRFGLVRDVRDMIPRRGRDARRSGRPRRAPEQRPTVLPHGPRVRPVPGSPRSLVQRLCDSGTKAYLGFDDDDGIGLAHDERSSLARSTEAPSASRRSSPGAHRRTKENAGHVAASWVSARTRCARPSRSASSTQRRPAPASTSNAGWRWSSICSTSIAIAT
jgi:hypothetical protein